jgi:hypothetical protein
MTWGSLCRREPLLRALADACHTLAWREVCRRARQLTDNGREYDMAIDHLAKVWAAGPAGPVHRRGHGSGDINKGTPMSEGRDASGRFAVGCKGGPGNPALQRLAKWKEAMSKAVTPSDIKAVVKSLIREAKAGSVPACGMILDRCCGRVVTDDLAAEINELGNLILELQNEKRRVE